MLKGDNQITYNLIEEILGSHALTIRSILNDLHETNVVFSECHLV